MHTELVTAKGYRLRLDLIRRYCTVGTRKFRHWVAKFIVPKWGDKVDAGIGLSTAYRPASLCSLVGLYDNAVSESTLSPQSGPMNLATEQMG